MIITKTPFRISFCGGGSDMESFYKEHGGCVISTSINKYIYLSVHPYFEPQMVSLKYSENELVSDWSQVRHSILRCVLKETGIKGIEIVSTADIPSGTGLGSSSSFTVGLLHALQAYQGKCIAKGELADWACRIEIKELGSPIGKQDQYAAAFGGLNFITFRQDGTVQVEPLVMAAQTCRQLQENLVMFYTGRKHNANRILKEQKGNIVQIGKRAHLIKICALASGMRHALENGDLGAFGEIMDEGWHRKKELAASISDPGLDGIYKRARENGAAGGKLLGAGGGGFFLFYCDKERQQMLEQALGLRRFPFSFEQDGSSVVYIGGQHWG